MALAAGAGELELNVMTPLVADNLAGALDVLTRAVRLLRTRAVEGLVVDRRRARALVAGSLIEATALSPYLGYEVTAELVKEARARGRPLREVVLGHGLLDARALRRVLSPAALTGPPGHRPGATPAGSARAGLPHVPRSPRRRIGLSRPAAGSYFE